MFDPERLSKFLAGEAAKRCGKSNNAAALRMLIEAARILIETHGAFDQAKSPASMMEQDSADIETIKEDPANAEIWINVAIKLLAAIGDSFPEEANKATTGLTMEAIGLLNSPQDLLGRLALIMIEKNGHAARVMKPWHRAIRENLKTMRGVRLDVQVTSPADLFPSQRRMKQTHFNIAHDAFRLTPFLDLLTIRIPVHLPDYIRVEHMNITAPSGSGKTQLLQNFLAGDLKTNNGILLFDTDGELSQTLIRHGMNDPRLMDRLVYINPSDPAMRPEINILKLGKTASSRQLVAYVMAALGEDLTGKMGGFFDWMAQAMSEIPGATLDTMIDILSDDAKAQMHLHHFSDDVATFICDRLPSGNYAQTREHVADRLLRFRAMGELGKMFRGKATRLDIAELLDAGKVVVVRIDKSPEENGGLGSYASLACRFFLAATVMSAQQRKKTPNRNYWWLYLDEVADLVGGGGDQFLVEAFIQLRKKGVGVIVAYQYLKLLNGNLREAALGNTSIKLGGKVKRKDKEDLADAMSCPGDLFGSLRKQDRQWGEMVCYIDLIVDQAAKCRFPFGVLESQPRMSSESYRRLMDRQCEMWADLNETSEPEEEPIRKTAFNQDDVVIAMPIQQGKPTHGFL